MANGAIPGLASQSGIHLRKIIQIDKKQGTAVCIRHGGKPLFHVPHHCFPVEQATKRILRLYFFRLFCLNRSVMSASLAWILFALLGILLCHTGNFCSFCESSLRSVRANFLAGARAFQPA